MPALQPKVNDVADLAKENEDDEQDGGTGTLRRRPAGLVLTPSSVPESGVSQPLLREHQSDLMRVARHGVQASLRQKARIIALAPATAAVYADRIGFRDDFLGDGARLRVALPRVTESDQLLRYSNFSIIFSLQRQLARLAAVNIDGTSWQRIGRRKPDTWAYDPRLPIERQIGRNLYDGIIYDYAQLVRRQDACSGRDAALAEQDTFHLPNGAPLDHQHSTGPWTDLENHVLDTIRLSHNRVSVLAGPVFEEDDPIDCGIIIPQNYFKIAAYVDEDGCLSAAGWVQRLPPLPSGAIEQAPGVLGGRALWQVPIARIAELTGLDLSPLLAADVLGRRRWTQSAGGVQAVPISIADDLLL